MEAIIDNYLSVFNSKSMIVYKVVNNILIDFKN